MKCSNCGSEIDPKQNFCPYCGHPSNVNPFPDMSDNYSGSYQNNQRNNTSGSDYRNYREPQRNNNSNPDDTGAFGFGVLGFFLPIVGLILFIVWKNDYPLRSRASGKGALISVILGVVVSIICIIISFVIASSYTVISPL